MLQQPDQGRQHALQRRQGLHQRRQVHQGRVRRRNRHLQRRASPAPSTVRGAQRLQLRPAMCGCASDADCNDGNACNGVETCNLATLSCQSGTADQLRELDDACNVGVRQQRPAPPKRARSAWPRHQSCDDGNACTKTDGCLVRQVRGQQNSVDLQRAATSATTSATATPRPVRARTRTRRRLGCNDGNACTQTDTGRPGACVGGSNVPCTASDQCHSAGTCDTVAPATQNPHSHRLACDDGNKCTQSDACSAGGVRAATPWCARRATSATTSVPATRAPACARSRQGRRQRCDDEATPARSPTRVRAARGKGSKPMSARRSGQRATRSAPATPRRACARTHLADTTTTCNDSDACTTTDKCDGQGNCVGSWRHTCQPRRISRPTPATAPSGASWQTQPGPCDDKRGLHARSTRARRACVRRRPARQHQRRHGPTIPAARPTARTASTSSPTRRATLITGVYSGPIAFNDKGRTPILRTPGDPTPITP